jgi:hypothetical protein
MYHGSDPFVLGKPLAIEYNPNVFEEGTPAIETLEKATSEKQESQPPKMQPQKPVQQEKAGFFITENLN